MLQKNFILIFFIFTFGVAKSQAPECFKFKEGKFRIADTRTGVVTIADRRGGYQTESSEALKAIVRFSIT